MLDVYRHSEDMQRAMDRIFGSDPCGGKKVFDTWDQASRSLKYLLRKKGMARMKVYRCKSCNGFHIGGI